MFSLIASLGILIGSNGRAVDSWTIPPSTFVTTFPSFWCTTLLTVPSFSYLAIFTALANLSVRYAAIQGVVIAWWLRAMNGSTLSKLHWDWRSGRSQCSSIASTSLSALRTLINTWWVGTTLRGMSGPLNRLQPDQARNDSNCMW